jgi:sporulation protein YabP
MAEQGQGKHNAILENRKKLVLTGVTDVDSFNDEEICLFTQLGELTVKGKNLHVNEMSVTSGDLTVDGDIWALVYGEKDRRKKVSAVGKLFR